MLPCQLKKNAADTKDSEIIYPKEQMYISCFLPNLSIRKIPKSVKSKFVTPTPILLKRAELSANPASVKILGA